MFNDYSDIVTTFLLAPIHGLFFGFLFYTFRYFVFGFVERKTA